MLEVQKYLMSGKSLDDLKVEFGITNTKHPDPAVPLVLVNYDQIDSPKMHPIVMECRALVLEVGTWNLVAKSFTRFFNEGESLEVTGKFDWKNHVWCSTKEDGSLINVFSYRNEVYVTTRKSWADGECGFSGKTWRDLVLKELVGFDPRMFESSDYTKRLNFVFEYCSVHNKVVRTYIEPKLFLLSIFPGEYEYHEDEDVIDSFARTYSIERPARFDVRSLSDVAKIVEENGSDPTWEGVVLRDVSGLRVKLKSSRYVALHHMRGEGDNLWNPKHIVPFVLRDEVDEVLRYFPEVGELVERITAVINDLSTELDYAWVNAHGIEDQKEFALQITKKTPTRLSGILFKMKKNGTIYDGKLSEEMIAAEDQIIKIVKELI